MGESSSRNVWVFSVFQLVGVEAECRVGIRRADEINGHKGLWGFLTTIAM